MSASQIGIFGHSYEGRVFNRPAVERVELISTLLLHVALFHQPKSADAAAMRHDRRFCCLNKRSNTGTDSLTHRGRGLKLARSIYLNPFSGQCSCYAAQME